MKKLMFLVGQLLESLLAKVGDGGEADMVDEVVTGVVGDAADEEDEENGDGDEGPDIGDGQGNELVEIQMDAEPVRDRDGDAGVGRSGVQNAVEDGPDEHGQHAVHGAGDGHEDNRQRQRRQVAPGVAEQPPKWIHRMSPRR